MSQRFGVPVVKCPSQNQTPRKSHGGSERWWLWAEVTPAPASSKHITYQLTRYADERPAKIGMTGREACPPKPRSPLSDPPRTEWADYSAHVHSTLCAAPTAALWPARNAGSAPETAREQFWIPCARGLRRGRNESRGRKPHAGSDRARCRSGWRPGTGADLG